MRERRTEKGRRKGKRRMGGEEKRRREGEEKGEQETKRRGRRKEVRRKEGERTGEGGKELAKSRGKVESDLAELLVAEIFVDDPSLCIAPHKSA